MPRRPRSHVLETKSRLKLEGSLPGSWIYRQEPIDYGIDGSVEIVAADETVSGDRFYVQLKATDSAKTGTALRIKLEEHTARYYARLGAPVLMARYHAPTDSLYVRWFHDLKRPIPQRRKSLKTKSSGSRTLTFQLDETDRWRTRTGDKLARDVRLWRWIKSPNLGLPIRLRLVVGSPAIDGVPAAEICRQTELLSRQLPDVLQVSELPGGLVHGAIRLDRTQATVELPAGFGMTLPWTPKKLQSDAASIMAADLLLATAIVVGYAGHASIATRIASAVALKSMVVAFNDTLAALAEFFVQSGQLSASVDLACDLVARGMPVQKAQLLVMRLATVRDRIAPDSAEEVQIRVERWAATVVRYGTSASAAVAHYNAGRWYGPYRRTSSIALRHYRRARVLDPEYANRQYFWAEIAAMLFESGHYVWAANAYARSLKLGADAAIRPRYADALLHAGEYRRAAEEFATYLRETPKPKPHWWLKARVLPIIIATATDTQRRNDKEANGVLSAALSDSPADQRMAREGLSTRALRLDALSPMAWFNLALARYEAGDRSGAFWGFLIAAVIWPSDLEAWVNAIGLGLDTTRHEPDSVDLFNMLVLAAFEVHGAELYRGFREQVQISMPPNQQDAVLGALRSILENAPSKQHEAEIRVIGDGGKVKYVPWTEVAS